MSNSSLRILRQTQPHAHSLGLMSLRFTIAACLITGVAGPFAAFAQKKPALDLSPFFAQVDLNHDGCISKAEWFSKGLPRSAWNMLKDKHDCVTVKAMTQTPAPEGIDANGDAKLTLEEFLSFDRKGQSRPPSP